jgi:crossover junction endodeoxyribonuclease RuvC
MKLNRKPLLSLGIDPSPNATGVVILRENGTPKPDLFFHWEIGTKNMEGMARIRHIVTKLMITIHNHKPDRIVIEGYSLNLKNASSVIPLVELGGLIRFMLHLDGFKWYEPRATELKMFATGKGNAPKEQVMLSVFKRWGYEAATNNLADAYTLAAMGLAQSNRLPGVTLDMRKIAGAMSLRRN